MAGYLPFDEPNLLTLYRKQSRFRRWDTSSLEGWGFNLVEGIKKRDEILEGEFLSQKIVIALSNSDSYCGCYSLLCKLNA
nr:hypothetical protein CFP56_42882 [Quercus suber]